MRALTTTALLITSTFLFTACSTAPTADSKAPVSDTAAKDSTPAAAPQPVAAPAPVAAKPADPIFVPTHRNVFFDYDSFVIKSEFNPMIEAHAKYLKANPNRKATIQGNADERGGSEYNLALGQKRAEAERKSLELLGVPVSQLEAVSFGKEKPRSHGHDEASWADNRRADIVYQSK